MERDCFLKKGSVVINLFFQFMSVSCKIHCDG